MNSHYDVLFIGSGQSANSLAQAFAARSHRTLMIERSALGGTCVNVGCTPTKTMIASGKAAYLTSRGHEYGIYSRGSSDFDVEMETVRQRKRDIVKQWHAGSERGLERAEVECMMGEAHFVGDKRVRVRCWIGEETEVTADKVFISTGQRPHRPSIPGLDDVPEDRVLDSTSIMELSSVPKHLVVFGGGYIGLEFGQLFRRFGAQVTIVQRNKQLAPREDEDVAECLRQILAEDGVNIHLASTVEAVVAADNADEPFVVHIDTPDGKKVAISGSHILAATGRSPQTDMLNLKATGVRTTSKGYVVVNDRLETSAPGIYALGDVHGGPAFTHVSYDDARIVLTNLLPSALSPHTPRFATTKSSLSRVLTPYVMYTDPQLAHVGLHDRDLTEHRATKSATMPMSSVARAVETGETRGLMKATVDAKTGEILGFTCLGVEGGEVMSIVQTAMMGGLKWWDLEAAVYAHPTLAESLNNLWRYLK